MEWGCQLTALVAGGAGFIGSHFVDLLVNEGWDVVVLDALTYSGNKLNLESALASGRVRFVHGRIEDCILVQDLVHNGKIDCFVNFAAETHVDRSIESPTEFIQANVVGVFSILEALRAERSTLSKNFRFLQVSTDEVFGSLGDDGKFSETSPYDPKSPYSAAKAAADHFCRAWHHTYGLPVMITNCSNNYGPRQFPEKLIPLTVTNALQGKPLPVYGNGRNVRDWIYVEDHCRGLMLALEKGKVGETYCFGGSSERPNIEVVEEICRILDEKKLRTGPHASLVEFVSDRPGHDFRYAIDDGKARRELGFAPKVDFKTGLRSTVEWYMQSTKVSKGKTA